MADACDHGNEPLGSIKGVELFVITEQLQRVFKMELPSRGAAVISHCAGVDAVCSVAQSHVSVLDSHD